VTLTLKRLIGTVAATAVMAGATAMAATPAQADGGYYGTWNLASVTLDKETLKCDGLPDEEDKCPAGMTLELKSDYRYNTTIKGFEIILPPGKGDFVTTTVNGTNTHVIVMSPAEYPTFLRVWRIKLQGTRYGAPQKMVLYSSLDNTDDQTLGGVKMVFYRNAK
jgi:hypothetical protein